MCTFCWENKWDPSPTFYKTKQKDLLSNVWCYFFQKFRVSSSLNSHFALRLEVSLTKICQERPLHVLLLKTSKTEIMWPPFQSFCTIFSARLAQVNFEICSWIFFSQRWYFFQFSILNIFVSQCNENFRHFGEIFGKLVQYTHVQCCNLHVQDIFKEEFRAFQPFAEFCESDLKKYSDLASKGKNKCFNIFMKQYLQINQQVFQFLAKLVEFSHKIK